MTSSLMNIICLKINAGEKLEIHKVINKVLNGPKTAGASTLSSERSLVTFSCPHTFGTAECENQAFVTLAFCPRP